MNSDNLEDLVLSGKLFNPPSRSTSPTRSRSPSPTIAQWPTDGNDYDYDSDSERRCAIEEHNATQQCGQDSIGMGPGRTGVKGVIRDHAEAAALARQKRAGGLTALNRAMEKASLGGKTWAEEDRERIAQQARLEGKAGSVVEGKPRGGRFGHLMEVGVRSFDRALEEDRNTWVVVHIYDPSLDRCAALDEALSRLARTYSSTKFLHARAGALGFATQRNTTSNVRPTHLSPFPITRRPSWGENGPDDPYGDVDDSDGHNVSDDEGDDDDAWEDDNVDTDVLPTLLAYRGGVLEHTWVRVDWEAKMGIEDLLRRHYILLGPDSRNGLVQTTESFSDEDDLDDGELVFGGSDDET